MAKTKIQQMEAVDKVLKFFGQDINPVWWFIQALNAPSTNENARVNSQKNAALADYDRANSLLFEEFYGPHNLYGDVPSSADIDIRSKKSRQTYLKKIKESDPKVYKALKDGGYLTDDGTDIKEYADLYDANDSVYQAELAAKKEKNTNAAKGVIKILDDAYAKDPKSVQKIYDNLSTTNKALVPKDILDRYNIKINTKTNTKTDTKTKSGIGTGTNTGLDPALEKKFKELQDKNVELEKYIKDNLTLLSADEAAELYGIDMYDLDKILDEYNKATEEYYGNAIAEQEELRTDYLRNNNDYIRRLVNNYIDSYKNAAPTATSNAAVAANTLGTMLTGNDTNAQNDYGMMQSVNELNEAKKAELANNPYAAEEYYNKIGTYLSSLSANKHASDVKQAVADLNAYSNRYAADRAYYAALAKANANRYGGIVTRNQNSAATAYQDYLNYLGSDTAYLSNLYNTYNPAYGSTTASNIINNNLRKTGTVRGGY